MMLRLRTNLLTGLLCATDYSGMDCPREAMRSLTRAWTIRTGVGFHKDPFSFYRSCDRGGAQTDLLIALSKRLGPDGHCHFCSIEDRLPPQARDYVAAALPPKESSAEVKIAG